MLTYLSIYLSFYPFTYLSIIFICITKYIYLSDNLSFRLSSHRPVHSSVCLPACLPINLSLTLHLYSSCYLSIYVYIYLLIDFFFYLSHTSSTFFLCLALCRLSLGWAYFITKIDLILT